MLTSKFYPCKPVLNNSKLWWFSRRWTKSSKVRPTVWCTNWMSLGKICLKSSWRWPESRNGRSGMRTRPSGSKCTQTRWITPPSSPAMPSSTSTPQLKGPVPTSGTKRILKTQIFRTTRFGSGKTTSRKSTFSTKFRCCKRGSLQSDRDAK